MQDMIRQGDVLVRPIAGRTAVPVGAAPVAPERGRVVLARGEATGHHHSFARSNRVALFRDDGGGSGGRLLLEVTGDAPAMLEHQEHAALPVAPGLHEVVRQRTYAGGVVQRVAD